jgi:transposase-like protein
MDETVKWTNLSCSEIADLLATKGFKVSRNIIRKLLNKHGYVKRKALKKSRQARILIAMLNLNVLPN